MEEPIDGEEPISADEAAFVPEDIANTVKESIDAVLQNQQYNEAKVGQWTSNCLEVAIKRLMALNKPFKYLVTCVIMQKTGAGLHTAASTYWDVATDGCRTVRWENKTMYAIVTVFGLAL